MNSVDAIKINFNPDNLLVLNIILALIMFGIALDIRREDFQFLWQNPKPAFIGMIGQLLILPAVTVGLVFIFQPPPSVALGMIAISACPGGNNSNYSTHLAHGNTALAVTTTSISVLTCIVTMPLYIWLGAKVIPNVASLNREVVINPWDMIKIVGGLILTPLVIGMFVSSRFPSFTGYIRKPFKILSLIMFFGLIIGAMAANLANMVKYVGSVFFIVLILNALAYAIGYYWGKINKLSEADCRALTFETGIHNITLALIIIFNFFEGLGGMALVAAWYGIWDLMTGFALALWWGRKSLVKEERHIQSS